jgi:cystathionine beta-lyase/cystathionine gamma-synthase
VRLPEASVDRLGQARSLAGTCDLLQALWYLTNHVVIAAFGVDGIGDGLLRLSVGLEEENDLVDGLAKGLASIGY